MAVKDPCSQYLENQVKTATPGKVLVMAFDGAIRFARIAAEKMKERQLDEQSANIIKVQNIILELMSSLNMDADRQLAGNLYSIYSHIFDRLTQANVHDDMSALEEAVQILGEMRQTWAEAELLVRSGEAEMREEARAA
jgi:flagellar protein FliS